MKVKDIPNGCVVWEKFNILGIVGVNLPEQYYECECKPVGQNQYDYEISKEIECTKE